MHIGIIGAGQLAQMLCYSAHPLGIKISCLAQSRNVSANGISYLVIAKAHDIKSMMQFAKSVDIVTIENENIDCDILDKINTFKKVFPPINAIRICQDRLLEKKFLKSLGIKTPHYQEIVSPLQNNNLDHFKMPAILKTARFGYDGKGQVRITNHEELLIALARLDQERVIIEEAIDFEYEVSQIAARNENGEVVFYPLMKNAHKNGILNISVALLNDSRIKKKAKEITLAVLKELNYVGVFAIEFFVKDNELIANEMAPRVHNSGHLTIEGALTSQFENHLRAISGLDLGSTNIYNPAAMINMISNQVSINQVLSIKGASFTTYHKVAKPNRKLGHITLVAKDHDELAKKIRMIENLRTYKASY